MIRPKRMSKPHLKKLILEVLSYRPRMALEVCNSIHCVTRETEARVLEVLWELSSQGKVRFCPAASEQHHGPWYAVLPKHVDDFVAFARSDVVDRGDFFAYYRWEKARKNV